ncbi:phosphorothioated DNA-binding restriction endonuclease [Pontibacter fetidus]|uniref:Restriction endonuclease n=1 Tax=Pontibacter fetidus TaxID=2700082 RepID=A0A6B2GX86_9BACT|nr:HNH endonuclease [Pontibacter fetidus]NDK55445.1 restriction endonuclease [Pontibacter fetidus]
MTNADLLSQFQNINTWKSKGTRAPHKPLLILLALGEIQRGNPGFIPFTTIEPKLKDLLIDFGPYRQSYYPNFPFTKLANDGLWQLNEPSLIDTRQDYSSKYLRDNHLAGKFPEYVVIQLQKDPELLKTIAETILEQNFPETLHQDILNAVGLDLAITPVGRVAKPVRKRDPLFRDSILKAYEYQCAVCGFSVRLRHQLLALEAAHIMWHQAGGPDVEVNGLALCATHHKLFDLGAFTVTEELKMRVSDEVNGIGANEWLLRYDGKSIKAPQKKIYYPNSEFTTWHVNEVFKGGYR